MSDADRLRAAADQCDAWAADTKAANSALLTSYWKIDAATAALLRTVADSARQQGTDAVWWPLIESGIWTDALALADVILGDNDD